LVASNVLVSEYPEFIQYSADNSPGRRPNAAGGNHENCPWIVAWMGNCDEQFCVFGAGYKDPVETDCK
jgi:hypothetical protein